jgi:hypothetical protein
MMHYELNDVEWTATKSCRTSHSAFGILNDRRVLNRFLWSCVQVRRGATLRTAIKGSQQYWLLFE